MVSDLLCVSSHWHVWSDNLAVEQLLQGPFMWSAYFCFVWGHGTQGVHACKYIFWWGWVGEGALILALLSYLGFWKFGIAGGDSPWREFA